VNSTTLAFEAVQPHLLASTHELRIAGSLAWKNANKCIGRAHHASLDVLDARSCVTTAQIFDALFYHISYATNNGAIKSVLTLLQEDTVDQKGLRIVNHQLIRYAGHKLDDDGKILGDPASVEFTIFAKKLGWEPKNPSPFNVLPIIIQMADGTFYWKEIPQELILEVPIIHPTFKWFNELKLKWYAIPIISDMLFDTGAQQFSAAPFNGHYMGTEIGARNLADTDRYNMLPTIAHKMGLDTKMNYSLWKDRALVELNTAVLYSYQEAGVRITDHHTESVRHCAWEEKERKSGCPVSGDWSWLVPPISGSSSPIFHREYENEIKKPGFFPRKNNVTDAI